MATKPPFRALFIHGVGTQDRDWYHDARAWLRTACKERGSDLHSVACWWAPAADKAEKKFLADVKRRGSDGKPSQNLVIKTLADALYWQSSPRLRDEIFYLLDLNVARFGGQPFTVFAHSLGGLIVTDWLRERPMVTSVRLCTFGCNIGLFNLGHNFRVVPQIREWDNFFYAADMLGFPLGGDPHLAYVKDVEVPAGLLGWGWFSTGLSHVRYWGDRRFWRKIVPAHVLTLR